MIQVWELTLISGLYVCLLVCWCVCVCVGVTLTYDNYNTEGYLQSFLSTLLFSRSGMCLTLISF